MTKPIRPNEGFAVAYERRIVRLIDEMDRSLSYWIAAAYRTTGIAQDSPVSIMQAAIRKLSRRWLRKFNEAGPRMADWFATGAQDRCQRTMRETLRDSGFSVKFKPTRAMNNAFQAVLTENVSLIKSIATRHLTAVEGAVMRSASVGGDLASLAKVLRDQAGVSRRRAAFIALDQNRKATAVFTRTRQIENGITKARWLHSAGGHTPRPEHVAFSGEVYEVAKGAFLEGEWTWPGVQINCRCVSLPVIPGLTDNDDDDAL